MEAPQDGIEVEILRALFSRSDIIFEWQPSVVRELLIHFAHYTRTSPTPKTYDDTAFQSWMRKWNQLGQAIGPSQPELAELLFKNLLSSLRAAQAMWGWVPKGSAYHNIGWSKILSGRSDEARAAEYYFSVAMIEDILQDLNATGKTERFVLNPAYKVLSSLYQKGQPFVDGILKFTTQVYRGRNRGRQKIFVENPDLILFELLMNGKTRMDASKK
jgi:hypothetical protein